MIIFLLDPGMIIRDMANLPPTEHNTYADIEAAYRCLVETYGVNEEDVILYGQSVGSGPTIDLASRLSRLRAVVLHSPILSGLRVLYPVKRTYWFDIYKVTFLVIDQSISNGSNCVFLLITGQIIKKVCKED
ncbi:putative alpha/Beta hydrolase [Helianthus debilis subsp. tardiflorus]